MLFGVGWGRVSNTSLSAEKGVTDICSAFFNFSSPKVPQKSLALSLFGGVWSLDVLLFAIPLWVLSVYKTFSYICRVLRFLRSIVWAVPKYSRFVTQLRGLCHPRTKNGHFFCDDCRFPGFSPIFRGFGQSLQKISAILLRNLISEVWEHIDYCPRNDLGDSPRCLVTYLLK